MSHTVTRELGFAGRSIFDRPAFSAVSSWTSAVHLDDVQPGRYGDGVVSDTAAVVREGTTEVVEQSGSATACTVRIHVHDAPASPSERSLTNGSIVLGAGLGADLVISDESVSRRHLQITVSPQGFELLDLGSRNGTFYQGGRVGRVTLDREAVIVLGRVRVTVTPESQSGAPVASPQNQSEMRGGSAARARLYESLVQLLRLPPRVIEQLESHIWSGDVQAFGNVIQGCAPIGELPCAPSDGEEQLTEMLRRVLDVERPYQEQKDQVTNRFIDVYLSMLLEHTGGNQSAAARVSGIDRAHLNKMITKFRRGSKRTA